MKMRKIGISSLFLVMVVTFAVVAAPVFAALVLVETSTKTIGATTVTWESSSQDMDYTLGHTITMTMDWTVDAGAASYDSFALKRFTPKSKKDPATGTTPTVTYPGSNGANSVDVAFKFTGLHLDKDQVPNVDIGNAHLKLYLMIDKDGDGTPETRAGYGVNVHVEDPQTP